MLLSQSISSESGSGESAAQKMAAINNAACQPAIAGWYLQCR